MFCCLAPFAPCSTRRACFVISGTRCLFCLLLSAVHRSTLSIAALSSCVWVLVQVCFPASSGSLTGHTTLHATSEQFSTTGAVLRLLPTTGGDIPGLDSLHRWCCHHFILAVNRCDLRFHGVVHLQLPDNGWS